MGFTWPSGRDQIGHRSLSECHIICFIRVRGQPHFLFSGAFIHLILSVPLDPQVSEICPFEGVPREGSPRDYPALRTPRRARPCKAQRGVMNRVFRLVEQFWPNFGRKHLFCIVINAQYATWQLRLIPSWCCFNSERWLTKNLKYSIIRKRKTWKPIFKYIYIYTHTQFKFCWNCSSVGYVCFFCSGKRQPVT